MRAYSTHRPVDIGTYPKNNLLVKEIVNFDNRTHCPEIDRKAWGYIEYDGYLGRKTLADYELTAQEYEVVDIWHLLKEVHARTREDGPAKTLDLLIDEMEASKELLKIAFAVYAKIREHDGRISRENREYYGKMPVLSDTVKWETLNPVIGMGLDDIHPTHIDQLMRELRTSRA